MEIFLIRLLQFVLAISLLVLLHEGGHFFFARLFGIRVEKFYIFFDPWFHLFEFKPKGSETAYGIGWLPLGGYCKIAGMIDESFDTEQMKRPAQDWEFRSKPAWQRLLVMIGGVLVNFLLALFIYSMIMFHWGESYVPMKNFSHGMKFNQEALSLGFQDGDILLSADGEELRDFGPDLFRTISGAHEVELLRGGERLSLSLPGDINLLGMLQTEPLFMAPLIPAVVDSVMPGTPAAEIGLMKGDRIVGLNGREIGSFNDYDYEVGRMQDLLAVAQTPQDSLAARKATLWVERETGQRDTLDVLMTADLKMGFYTYNIYSHYETVKREYGFLESFPAGISYGCHVLASYVDDLKYVFTAEGAKSLGGFGTIGSLFPAEWDWYVFWKMTAFLSIILAFMNILPIPALDGGHVLFLLYEMVARRKPSEKFMLVAEYIGFGIILLLLIVANLNDILRWLGYL